MKHVTCREVELLLPATAAGALDVDEEETVRDHLAICPPCVKQLHDFQDTVEQLAFAVPQVDPPQALRAKVLQAIAVTAQPARGFRPVPLAAAARPRQPRAPGRFGAAYRRFAPAALAACLLLLVASGIWIGIMTQRVEMMNDTLAQQQELRDLLQQPNSQMAMLKATNPDSAASGQAIMAPGHNRLGIMAAHLPTTGGTYQVWLLKHGNTAPVLAGHLVCDGAGVAWAVVNTPADPNQMAGIRITDTEQGSSTGVPVLEGWYR
ncbi:MAG TPA: anti-sigma factor [Chloroflexia bacterium]|jgi:hypothetical protein|nr:anti-sigma factor [Chloroflexia bacterium]